MSNVGNFNNGSWVVEVSYIIQYWLISLSKLDQSPGSKIGLACWIPKIPKKQLLDILAVISYKVAKVLRSGWMQLAFVFFVLNYDSCSCRLLFLFLLINVSLTLSSHYCWTHVCWSGGLSQVSDMLFSKSDGTQTQASLWYGPSSSLYFFCFLSFALCSFGNIFCKSCTLEV